MKNSIKIMMVVVGLAFLSGAVFAQDSGYARDFKSADGAPILKVQNQGNEAVSIAWAIGTNCIVTIGTVATTIDVTSATYNTVQELAVGIAACTNSAGKKPLKVDFWCSLGTDVVSDYTLNRTDAIAASNHEWVDVGRWDTSGALYYTAAVAPGDNPKVLQSIHGNALGTGNITVDVYAHNAPDGVQTKVYTHQVVSPVYVWAAITGTTNNNVADAISGGVLALNSPVSFARQEGVLVRVARATTATTGGVGITVQLRK